MENYCNFNLQNYSFIYLHLFQIDMVSSSLGHQIKIITHNKYKIYKQEYKYTNQNEIKHA